MLGAHDGASSSWVDVTERFDEACKNLKVGVMVHGDSFNLFEAMSAIEIGCAKMDVGHVDDKELSIEDRIEDGAAPLDLPPLQQLAVVDQLLAALSAYFRGDAMAQTLHTCIYMMRPARNSALPVLDAACHLLSRISHVIAGVAGMSGVLMDDEISMRDPVPAASAPPAVPEPAVVDKAAAVAEEALRRMKKAAAAAAGGAGGKKAAAGEDAAQAARTEEVVAALRNRLAFLKALLKGLNEMEPGRLSGMTPAFESFRTAKQLITEAAGTIGLSESTNPPGFFSDLIPRRKLAMPRHVSIPSRPEGIQLLTRTVSDMEWVAGQLAHCNSFDALREMLYAFNRRTPGPVARSFVYHALSKKDRPAAEIPSEAPWTLTKGLIAREFGLSDKDSPALPTLTTFLEQAETILQTWQQLMCLERSRCHRKVRRYVGDWAELYKAAAEAAQDPAVTKRLKDKGWLFEHTEVNIALDPERYHPLCLFVERLTASALVENVLVGLDLELYQPRELGMVFWYSDYLLSNLADCIKAWEVLHPKGCLRELGSRKEPVNPVKAFRYLSQAVPVEAAKYITMGLLRLQVALRSAGLQRERDTPFNTAQEAFDQRFCHMHLVQRPVPLYFDEYRESTDASSLPAPKIYQLAGESFMQAARVCDTFRKQQGQRASREDLEALAAIARVAAQNATACQLLLRVGAGLSIGWDFTHHPRFPVLALRSDKKPAGAGSS